MLTLLNAPEVPGASHAQELSRFVQLLSDPKSARTLIADMQKAKEQAQAAINEARDLQRQVMNAQAKLDADHTEFEVARAAMKVFMEEQTAAIDKRHDQATERERQVALRENDASKKLADLDSDRADLESRKSAHARDAAALAKDKKLHDAMHDVVRRKLAHLDALNQI